MPTDLIDRVILPLVSRLDNAMLTNLPSMEEVKIAVFSMNGDGAHGLDGFGGCFYKKLWEVSRLDVFNSVM